jgi:hypothetical protein
MMLAKLLEQDHRQKARPAKPPGVTWNGAGGCVIARR